MSTPILSQTVKLLTPALLAGAHQSRPEWRSASLHGQLHFWARVLAYDTSPAKMRSGEVRLTGGFLSKKGQQEQVAAPFAAWLEGEVPAQPPEYFTCPHDHRKGRRAGIPTGCAAQLCWTRRASTDWTDVDANRGEVLNADFARLLRTWVLLGALGLRANRAAGSIWVPKWFPTLDQFKEQVEALRLPPEVQVRVLPHVSAQQLESWRNSLQGADRNRLQNEDQFEQLRGIATDTVGGYKDDIPDNPLGYAGIGSERKASPLKLKVGRFADGLRLIAVHDQRDGRGGKLADAIDALTGAGKLLGQLLRDGTVVGNAPAPAPPPVAAAGTAGDDVAQLLAGKFDYPAILRYGVQVQAWQAAGRATLVSEFINATQSEPYRGLRQQPWYQKAVAALVSAQQKATQ
jgi:hypothetical protein